MTQAERLVEKIKDEILGKAYELSFAFVSKSKIQELNNKYRKKNAPTDVLSFPLSKDAGEILICKEIANTKTSDFGMTKSEFLLFITIHGILHLKGFEHGEKMEKLERKYLKKYTTQ